MIAEVVPATETHVAHIAANVRAPDREELWASGLMTPEKVMLDGLKYSDRVMTGLVDGEPVCMWGVAMESLIGNVGVPWMVGTDRLDHVAIAFLRRNKDEIQRMFSGYDLLQNFVDVRNTRAIRWLKWIGFKVEEEAKPYGYFNMPFYKFEMGRESCVAQL